MTHLPALAKLRSSFADLGFTSVSDPTLERCAALGADLDALMDRAKNASVNGDQEAWASLKARVRRVLVCAGSQVAETLRDLRLDAPLAEVVRAARAQPDLLLWCQQYASGDKRRGQSILEAFERSPANADGHQAQPSEPRGMPAEDPPVAVPEATPSAPALESAPSAPVAGTSPTGSRTAGTETPQREGVHVYGGAAALFFEPARHRRTRKPVLIVDGCRASGPRVYDWSKKIVLQMSINEMLSFYAVLTGQLRELKIDAHGEANDKRMEVKDQDNRFFVSLTQRGMPAVGVPISPLDAAQLALLISRSLIADNPQLRDLGGLDAFVSTFVRRLHQRAA